MPSHMQIYAWCGEGVKRGETPLESPPVCKRQALSEEGHCWVPDEAATLVRCFRSPLAGRELVLLSPSIPVHGTFPCLPGPLDKVALCSLSIETKEHHSPQPVGRPHSYVPTALPLPLALNPSLCQDCNHSLLGKPTPPSPQFCLRREKGEAVLHHRGRGVGCLALLCRSVHSVPMCMSFLGCYPSLSFV